MYALNLSKRSLELISFASGILLHNLVLRHGEWNLCGPTFCGASFSFWLLTLVLFNGLNSSLSVFRSSAFAATTSTWAAIFGVFLSMAAYRLFFHRLRRFPGPFGAKLTSWWASSLHGRRWHFYEGLHGLHKQYGDYVRVAPDALSIIDPAAVNAVHGPDSRCIKGSFYSIAEPQRNLLMIRNKHEHARKRRDWDRAFNVKSLNDYDPIVWTYTQQLMDQIKANVGKPMNVAKWLQFFAFDIMTDLAFGRSFDSVKTGKASRMMEEVEAPVMVFGLFHYVPWVAHFFKLVPFMVAHKAKFDQYLDSLVEERKKMVNAKRDVFSWFLDPYNKEPVKTPQMQKNLIGDAMLIVIAGSGPTAPAVAATLYHLALRPDLVERLHKELRKINFTVGETTHSTLANVKFLDALISEALRLHPPIRSGPERMTPPEGLQIGETYVPGNIRIQTPLYSLHKGMFPSPCW